MVDWREWAPQIIASIIGSSLIVTALTSAITFINKPAIDISPTVSLYVMKKIPSGSACAQYTTDFRNTGHSQASHVRLTLSYPNTTIVNTTTVYKNENMTMKVEDRHSVAVFLPRLSVGGHVIITTIVNGRIKPIQTFSSSSAVCPILNSSGSRVGDIVTGSLLGYCPPYVNYIGDYRTGWPYYFEHNEPFSITATYDEGNNAFASTEALTTPHTYFDTQLLIILVPSVLGFLAFAIGFRHKRKSVAKFAFDVLHDIEKVKKELSTLSSKAIFSTSKWDQSNKDIHPFFNNYKDYHIINNLYKSLEKRDSDLSTTDLSDDFFNDELMKKNKICLTLAQSAYRNFDWAKFYKFDLVSGIPSIIAASLFITFISEGIPFFLLWAYGNPDGRWYLFPYFTITSFIIRSITGFLIVGGILHFTHGIRNYFLGSFSRSITFLGLSVVILGLPMIITILQLENQRLLTEYTNQHNLFKQIESLFNPVLDFIFLTAGNSYRIYLAATIILFDIGRMFLLFWAAWATSKRYEKNELKGEQKYNR